MIATGRGVVPAWVATRGLAVAALVVVPEYRTVSGNSDVWLSYAHWHQLLAAGRVPYRDFPLEYPPGVLPLLALPGGSAAAYVAAFTVAALLADALLLWQLARTPGWRVGAWAWVVLPALLGPLSWGRFDAFLAPLLIGSALAVHRRRWGVAAGLVVTAAAVKLWPALLLLPLLRVAPRPLRRRLCAGVAVAGAGVGAALAAVGAVPGLWWMLRYHLDRGLEVESLWALPAFVAAVLGEPVTAEPRFGSLEVVGGPVPALLLTADLVLLAALAGWLLLVWRHARPDRPGAYAGALALLVVAVLLGSKVLSAQFLLWVVAAAVALADQAVERARLLVATGTAALSTHLLLLVFGFLSWLSAVSLLLAAAHTAALLYALGAAGVAGWAVLAGHPNAAMCPQVLKPALVASDASSGSRP